MQQAAAPIVSFVSLGCPQALVDSERIINRLRAELAAMAAALGGSDAVVFTGGVGENSPEARALALKGLELLTSELDPELNSAEPGDRRISTDASDVAALLIRSREDLEMAGQVRGLLDSARSDG